MVHLRYLAVLLGCLLGSGWLEFFLRTRVYRRWLRLVVTVLPVVLVFVLWDIYAIGHLHWTFDPQAITTVIVIKGVPLDEVLFFIIIPICAILTFEAVRSSHPQWHTKDDVK